jgi:hypothetical protein
VLCLNVRSATRTHDDLGNDPRLPQRAEEEGQHAGEHDDDAYLQDGERQRRVQRVLPLTSPAIVLRTSLHRLQGRRIIGHCPTYEPVSLLTSPAAS